MKIYRIMIKMVLLVVISLSLASCLVRSEGMSDHRGDNGRHRGWNNHHRDRHETEGTIQLNIRE